MKPRARWVTIAAAVLGAGVIAVLLVVHWASVCDHLEAWRFQLTKEMTLSAVEFLRRFLTHVLPKGFVRIRHYGFLANCRRRAAIELSRELLSRSENGDQESRAASAPVEPHDKVTPCPACKKGRMVIVTLLDPGDPALEHLEVACANTS